MSDWLGRLFGDGAYDDAGLTVLVPFPTWVTVLVVAVAVAVVGLAAWNLRDAAPRRRRLLLVLRAAVVMLAVYLYLQPAVQLRNVTRVRNHLVVLADGSRSMAVADGPDGPTRAGRVAQFLGGAAPELTELARDHAVEVFTFGDELQPTSAAAVAASERPPESEATHLVEVLDAVRQRFEGKDLAGVVMLSDGGDNGALGRATPQGGSLDPALELRLAALGVPVHTFTAGDPGAFADLSVRRVSTQEFAFVHAPVEVDVDLHATGLDAGGVIAVTLEQDGRAVQSRKVTFSPGTTDEPIQFTLSPDRVGRFVYTVRAEVLPGEAIRDNNRKDFVLRVIRDKARVLQVAGRPSWDERFLRKVLKRNPNVDLISFFILRTTTNQRGVADHELALIPFPTRELFEEELGSFDVVILQDFDYRPYQMARYLPHVARFVRDGGSLLMIGGSQSFSAGGYEGTAVGDLLPVALPPAGFEERMLSTSTFPARPTVAGARHPITALSPDRAENERIWRGFPMLEGVNVVGAVRPGAVVILDHPLLTMQGGANHPVAVLGKAGKGRVMAMLTDSSWRWALPAAAEGGDPRYYQRFWNNSLRWLLADPEWKQLQVHLDQDQVIPGARVRAEVSVVDDRYEPAARVPVEVRLRAAGRQEAVEVRTLFSGPVDDQGHASLEIEAGAPGAWVVEASAVVGGEPADDSAVFLVGGARPELDDAALRDDLLQAIAGATGGRHQQLPDASLDDLPLEPPRILRVDRRHNVELWSHVVVLLLGVALMGSEWWLRRRFGFL